MYKKLISLEEELFNKIKDFSERYNKTFTDSMRTLLQLGLTVQYNEKDPVAKDMLDEIKDMKEKIEEMSWWSADEGSSKLHNLEVAVAEIEKKLNILTSISKHFKGHMENREIHLQD